jgi:hypothetical protein
MKSKCTACGTTLNSYNKGKTCHAHTPGNLIVEHSPKSLCTSYEEPADMENDEVDVRPLPGSTEYKEATFDETIVGYVNWGGKQRDLPLPYGLDPIVVQASPIEKAPSEGGNDV